MERTERCETCKFWNVAVCDHDDEPNIGPCRMGLPVANSTGLGCWPLTYPDDWCGGWQSRQPTMPTYDEVMKAIRIGNDEVMVPVYEAGKVTREHLTPVYHQCIIPE